MIEPEPFETVSDVPRASRVRWANGGAVVPPAAPPTPEEIRAAIEDSRDREAPSGPSFELVTDIFTELPPRNYLVPSLNLGPGAPNGFFAYSWSGKSIIVQDAVLSIASGSPVFGQFTCRRGVVVHVDHEQGLVETLDRYQRLARARGLTREDVGDRIRVASLPPIYLNTPGAEDAYKRAVDGAAAFYVDSLGAAQPGMVENEASFAQGLYMLGRVSEATGATALFVGHTGKIDLSPDKPSDGRAVPRGTSAIVAACGTAFALSGGKGEPKLVTMIKGRSLGGVQCEDFYLELEAVRIDAYSNRDNPADPGGFRIVYRTVEQVKPPESPDRKVEANVARVVEVVRRAGPKGVPGADAVAEIAGMKAANARVAVKLGRDRGLLDNVARLKSGERDERHPRLVAQDVPFHSSPPKGGGRGTSEPGDSSDPSRDERDE